VKIQSELHGDMQSQAEMTWPARRRIGCASNKTVGPYLPWALENCEDLSLVREDRDERTSGVSVVLPRALQASYVRIG
jgi:hypothetical protein